MRGRQFHFAVGRNEFIENCDLLSCSDFSAVLGIIVKILGIHHAVLITDEAISLDIGRIKINLNLRVLRDGIEGSLQRGAHHTACLNVTVDIAVVAISLVGKLLCQGIIVIACSESEDGEEDLAFSLLLHQVDQLGVIGLAKVEITVRQKEDTVVAALNEGFLCKVVGGTDSRFAVGSAIRVQRVDRIKDQLSSLRRALCRLKRDLAASRIGDD